VWELRTQSAEICGANAVFAFTIKRKPTLYNLTVILPLVCQFIQNDMVFLLPVDSGEWVSFAVTILLAYSIFMASLSSTMPSPTHAFYTTASLTHHMKQRETKLPEVNRLNWHSHTHIESKLSYILIDHSFTDLQTQTGLQILLRSNCTTGDSRAHRGACRVP
jgi:hypothetical protein